MAITLNTVSYTQDTFLNSDKVKYVSPSNSFSTEDSLQLGRVYPKPNGTFKGVARPEVRRAKTVTLPDGSTAVAVVTVSASLPVGMTQAEVNALRDDVGDFLIGSDAGTLFWNLDITY